MSNEHSSSHILQSLFINMVIAVTKGIVAFYTKSGAMLAEAIHSAADCGNQVLLLIGVRNAQKPPDASHPLGYGRNVYFWSFMVALMLFAGGGVFSIYEGIHKIHTPEEISKVWLAVGILVFSILLEGAATISNIKELNHRRGIKPFFKFLQDTKDSDLVVIFGENAAAVIGLFLALISLLIANATGDSRWDGIGSIGIGLVLVGVAVFLAVEVQSLLLGEAADPEIELAIKNIIEPSPELGRIISLITVQQGPGEVMVSVKLTFTETLNFVELCKTINEFEKKLREVRPEVKWCFVEPDMFRENI